jgi:hypothetical protein
MPGGLHDRLALCDDFKGERCPVGRFLASGDILLVRMEAEGFLLVSFVDSNGVASEGWVRRDRTQCLSPEYGINSSWEGDWLGNGQSRGGTAVWDDVGRCVAQAKRVPDSGSGRWPQGR